MRVKRSKIDLKNNMFYLLRMPNKFKSNWVKKLVMNRKNFEDKILAESKDQYGF
jgi:hypothetical protein